MSTGALVNRGGLGSSGGLLSRGAPVTVVGLLSTCSPWSTGGLGRCGGLWAEGALGTAAARQTEAVHLKGSGLHRGKCYWVKCCNPVAAPCSETARGPGTLPSERAAASASAAPVAEKTAPGEGPGKWRTAMEADSGAAAVLGAVEQKMNEPRLFRSRGLKGSATHYCRDYGVVH